jgi:hypothetical protein
LRLLASAEPRPSDLSGIDQDDPPFGLMQDVPWVHSRNL